MVRICHVTPFFEEQHSGPERFVDTITTHQRDAGVDVTILTTTRFKKNVGSSITNGIKKVKIFSYKNIWQINPVSFIIPYLRKSNFDIIHIHSYLYFISNQGVLFGRIKKIPLLLHLHGGIGLPPYQTSTIKITAKAFYDKTLGYLTISNANLVASVSKNDLRKVKTYYKVPKAKLIHIPNAVNLKLFTHNQGYDQRDNDGSFHVLYIGDIEPWKGIGFLEKWIKDRRYRSDKKLNFRFIGQGSLSWRLKALEKLCKNSNIKVEYLGQKPHKEIPKLLSESQALILPSFWEGLPTVILEAMAARVPVIATPVGDIPNLIQNEKNGLLIKPNFTNLDNALEFVINNPNHVKQMTKKAFNTITDTFNSRIIHKDILKAYVNLTNNDKT